ncbi:MAG: hypothetical protein II208_03725 [Alphaproteobacteria bacterium]|nr:hypothetical protein [Alphaproteobacteria bacterium]
MLDGVDGVIVAARAGRLEFVVALFCGCKRFVVAVRAVFGVVVLRTVFTVRTLRADAPALRCVTAGRAMPCFDVVRALTFFVLDAVREVVVRCVFLGMLFSLRTAPLAMPTAAINVAMMIQTFFIR